MQNEKLIIKLQKELEFIKDDVEGILLYGSCASDTGNLRSDIDICIIKSRKSQDMGLKVEDDTTNIDKITGAEY